MDVKHKMDGGQRSTSSDVGHKLNAAGQRTTSKDVAKNLNTAGKR